MSEHNPRGQRSPRSNQLRGRGGNKWVLAGMVTLAVSMFAFPFLFSMQKKDGFVNFRNRTFDPKDAEADNSED